QGGRNYPSIGPLDTENWENGSIRYPVGGPAPPVPHGKGPGETGPLLVPHHDQIRAALSNAQCGGVCFERSLSEWLSINLRRQEFSRLRAVPSRPGRAAR